MKRLFTLLIVTAIISSCSSGGSSASSSDTAKADTAKSALSVEKPKDTEAATKWSYEEQKDKMTSATNYFAAVDANEELQFEFPYDGGSTATFMVRHMDKENSITLSVSKGQFHVGVDGGAVRIRFDDKKPMTFACNEPSDGSSDVIFIEGTKKILKELKTAKKMTIEAEFYEAGLKQMEFQTDGFKWAH